MKWTEMVFAIAALLTAAYILTEVCNCELKDTCLHVGYNQSTPRTAKECGL